MEPPAARTQHSDGICATLGRHVDQMFAALFRDAGALKQPSGVGDIGAHKHEGRRPWEASAVVIGEHRESLPNLDVGPTDLDTGETAHAQRRNDAVPARCQLWEGPLPGVELVRFAEHLAGCQ